MTKLVLPILIGVVAGIIDVIPMFMQKLDKYSIASAFVQWIILGVIITNTNIFGLQSWLNGLVYAVLLASPIVILVMKEDPKSVIPILFMSAFLGSSIGFIDKMLGL